MQTLFESIFDVEDQEKSIDVSKNIHIVKKFYNKCVKNIPKYKDLIGNDLKIGDIVLCGDMHFIGLGIIKEIFHNGERLIVDCIGDERNIFCDECIKCSNKMLNELYLK